MPFRRNVKIPAITIYFIAMQVFNIHTHIEEKRDTLRPLQL